MENLATQRLTYQLDRNSILTALSSVFNSNMNGKVSSRFNYKGGTRMSKDLRQTFAATCDLFNDGKYEELLPAMHIDIVMKRVDDPGSVIGIGNVSAYLKGHQAQQQPQLLEPKFEHITGQSGMNGVISGTAYYQDKKHVPTRIRVRFSFTFTKEDPDDDWLLINTFAVPIE
jgi:hypothetical protein